MVKQLPYGCIVFDSCQSAASQNKTMETRKRKTDLKRFGCLPHSRESVLARSLLDD